MSFIEYGSLIRDILIDLTALYFFAYVILYHRFRNKELFVTFSLFNIFMIMVIMAITRSNFNIALGFGLFALLSMVQLRSMQFTKAEMAYLFGGVSLAVINGAGIADLSFVLTCNFVIVIGAWIISGWSVEHSAYIVEKDNVKKISVVLDHIDEAGIRNYEIMKRNLSARFSLDVVAVNIRNIDYVKDSMDLRIAYHVDETGQPIIVDFEDVEESRSMVTAFPDRSAAAAGE